MLLQNPSSSCKELRESELHATVRASTEALGIATLLSDFGFDGVQVRVGMDANAAIGIIQRQGLNKLRHVEVDVLWLQEQQARRILPLKKVLGPENPSDMYTKHVGAALIEQYLKQLGLDATGRADIAQKLHSLSRISG